MRFIYTATILAVGLALTGCQRTSYGGSAPSAQAAAPAPLTPAPVGGVQGSQLPPPGDQSAMPAGQAPGGQQQQMASLGTGNGPALKKEALIGRWTIASSTSKCDIFLALTKWTGGYRAATRNCSGSASNVSAWDVKGNQVVLSDSTGNQLASLSQTGTTGYSGSTTDGQPITLSR